MHVLSIRVDPSRLDLVSGLLFELGVSGFEERTEPKTMCLVVYSEHPAELHALQTRLVARLAELHVCAPDFAVERLDDAWRTNWTEYLGPEWLTDNLVIQPASSPAPSGQPTVIRFLPRLAFGTGGHPTTKLAARTVARWNEATPGRTMLDVGTGNGVLALVACVKGAACALGLDLDPLAVHSATENARLNGLSERVRFETTPLDQVPGSFDLVVANIDAPTLRKLGPQLCDRTQTMLVVTGLLHEQRSEVEACFVALGMRLSEVAELDGWCLLEFVHDRTSDPD
jgi:ribosomal protein L11 methyltransferase